MIKIITLITIVTMLTNLSFASFNNDYAGTTSAQFLKIGVGARVDAMGGAGVAITRDVNSMYWNPAGLSRISVNQLSFMRCMWFQEITYDQLGFAYRNKLSKTALGLMLNYLTMEKITKIDNVGNVLNETFAPRDLAVTLTYSKKLSNKMPVGINLKYIDSKIEKSATAFAVDIGSQYKLSKKLMLGLNLQNIGTKIKYNIEEYSLPFNIKFGFGYYHLLKKSLLILAVDMNAATDENIKVNAGLEYNSRFGKNLSISPRIGFRSDKGNLVEGSNSLSAGFGLKHRKYNFDYAWAPYGELGNTHKISLILKFPKKKKKVPQPFTP